MYFSSIPEVYWARFIRTVGGGKKATLSGALSALALSLIHI